MVCLLWVGVVGASPFVSTVVQTAGTIRATDGVWEENSADHTRHDHDENGQNLEKTSENGSCFCMCVVLGPNGTLDNNLSKRNSLVSYSQ